MGFFTRLICLVIGLTGLVAATYLLMADRDALRLSNTWHPVGHQRLANALQSGGQESGVYSQEIAEALFARRPRHELSRVLIANKALAQQDFDRFLAIYLPIFRTDLENHAIYAQYLAQVAIENDLTDQLRPLLREKPPWGEPYLQALLQLRAPSYSAFAPNFEHYPEQQPALIRRIIQAQGLDAGYATFANINGADGQIPAPYNPQFRDLVGEPPFNWEYNSRQAERDGAAGLFAFFQGTGNPKMVQQLLPVTPGPKTLTASMSGQSTIESGRFDWQISCVETGEELLRKGPERLTTSREDFVANFTVPDADCSFIALALIGRAGQFPRYSSAFVYDVAITRVGEP